MPEAKDKLRRLTCTDVGLPPGQQGLGTETLKGLGLEVGFWKQAPIV